MMTLAEFKANIDNEMQSFVRMWINGSLKAPKSFPTTMEYGDWFEQFMAFSGEEENQDIVMIELDENKTQEVKNKLKGLIKDRKDEQVSKGNDDG